MKYKYYWVIKSKEKTGRGIFGNKTWLYFAKRTSLKNKRFASDFHIHVKWFATKQDAEQFYFKKTRFVRDLSGYVVKRKKMHLDSKGNYDYWKNRESLYK